MTDKLPKCVINVATSHSIHIDGYHVSLTTDELRSLYDQVRKVFEPEPPQVPVTPPWTPPPWSTFTWTPNLPEDVTCEQRQTTCQAVSEPLITGGVQVEPGCVRYENLSFSTTVSPSYVTGQAEPAEVPCPPMSVRTPKVVLPIDDIVAEITDLLHENVQFHNEHGHEANGTYLRFIRPWVRQALEKFSDGNLVQTVPDHNPRVGEASS